MNFYSRRARRIIPALLVMVLLTLAAGAVLLSPEALILLGQQATFSLVGASNIYFWGASGYFSPEAHTQPLLHTWSLGVEEQFYLLWPIALLFMSRTFGLRTGRALFAIFVLIAASFVSIFLLSADFSTFSFFMLPTRAWQLAMGGLLVFLPNLEGKGQSESIKLVGLLLLLAAIFLIEPNATYPGLSALLPAVGTALLIWPTERKTRIASFFGLAPLRYFGRISYSLYLWHWPPMVMYLTWNLSTSLTIPESIALFLFAWGAAHLSWRFVEEPFRRNRISDKRTLAASFVIVCVAASISWTFVMTGGAPNRLDIAGQELSAKMSHEMHEPKRAFCDFRALIEQNLECAPPSENEFHALLMGDSHANHLLRAIQDAFPAVKISTITRSGCRPVVQSAGKQQCVAMYNSFFDDVLPDHRFDAIILSARWRNGEHQNIGKTVDLLGTHTDRLIVLGQTVEYDHPLPELLMANYLPRRSSDVQAFMSKLPEIRDLDQQMARQLSNLPVEYYSMIEAVCPNDKCTVFSPSGIPLVWDYGHFNLSGARLIVERLKGKGFSLP
ncbi:Peptidoglycan/LPS O-acetylase OafA/YrhL, contains acyltransferase and SGNH-hydrolase domains [Shimia aestuarii]|uniref:Peptidoglycan/LPS O-acetylase OafA/YrhL, contains acyltransferase and SGNH-hydrolase domains n=2 Tax=Shimia aestuarii TaxID=254406 RepID=A0A1I4HCG0_9RHOB|nr:Peptidoglycan/LPS O-acetylase OafA/YrhL, contains acyltransferase and SGNH-hydrolase domains [Shimia aestuarii]